MKKIILTILWTVFWLTLQSTVLAHFPSDPVRLDAVFLSVVAIGFFQEFNSGFLPVFFMSIIADAAAYAPFGIVTSVYIISFCIIRFATSTIYSNSVLARLVWTTIVSVIALWTESLLLTLILKNPSFMIKTLFTFVPQSVLNGVLGMALIPLFIGYLNLSWQKLFRKKGLVLH